MTTWSPHWQDPGHAQLVREDFWLRLHQPLLVRMANTDFGRDLLCVERNGLPLVGLRKNEARFYAGTRAGRHVFVSDFRIGARWANLIRARWREFNSYARYFRDRDPGVTLSPLVRYARAVAADTLTRYPDPHPESSTADGWVRVYDRAGWAAAHDATDGDASGDTDADLYAIEIGRISSTQYYLWRSFFLFDTSSLSSGATVSDAVLSLYGSGSGNLFAGLAANVYSASPASNTAIGTADFDQVGSTAFCDTSIAFSSWATGYNAFPFNASGLAAVSKTNVSKFSCREANKDAANVDTGSAGQPSPAHIACKFAEDATAANGKDPKLVVTFTLGGGALSVGPADAPSVAETLGLTLVSNVGLTSEVRGLRIFTP